MDFVLYGVFSPKLIRSIMIKYLFILFGYNVNLFQLDILVKDSFSHLKYPRGETVFDFLIDETQRCYIDWQSKELTFTYDKDLPYFNMLVPTIDTAKYSYIL